MVNVNDIASWRERIFASLLSVVLVVGAISTLAIIPFLVKQGLWPVALADSIALVWIFVIWRLKQLSYNTRVLNFLGVVYVLSIALLLSIGPASFSYLLGPPLIASILLSLRPAMLSLALGAVSLVALGATGHISLSVPGWEHDPLKASMVAAINYTTVGAMLSLTCSTLLQGLAKSLGELELTSAAVSRLNDMVLIAKAADSEGAAQPVTFANDAFLRRTGYAREAIVGHDLTVLQGPGTDQAAIARIHQAMASGQPCNTELMIYTRGGDAFWVEIEMVPFARSGERHSHWVIVGRDITERRTAADAIHRLAFYDVLTGLPNRRLLMERLGAVVEQARAGSDLGAVLYLDLDKFKDVNDARGHATGDALLQHAARRLGQAVRVSDTVARIGGDEFVVLLEGLGTDAAAAAGAAMAMADLVRSTLAAPLDLEGQAYQIASSIGVALSLTPGASAHDLLREADTAMYHAKAAGRNGVVLFERAMLADAQDKLTLERDLALALDNGELAMHLQLQVDHRGAPAGAELLMRWRRADGSMVRPDIFIPVAESSGMIVSLGHWALRQACEAWLALAAAGHAMPLSINVSPLQFRQPDFVQQVRAVLAETGAPPHQLIFEVTEGLLIEDIGQTIVRMRELAGLGIRFSVDDFGTGYSNLAYLRQMPLYELKIDKSFMHGTPHDVNGTAIVQSILSMAGHLGLRVVAEGIETQAQASYLAEHGQPHMQGFLYHRPMPLGQVLERLGIAPSTPAGAAALPAQAQYETSGV
ncbi:EAL domain-containing protein [Massilia forsythiae]|uniref:EAL domain-containing protein n=1 Tax=Massilia forsythiae TaxID=2728020 RepID=A0A7Z2W1I4_9BURK|nr:EAL domain-containing protein [Massilia forsythiae]QJE02752.1 EAL domain-containing protein [Massilia forsythiae]